MKTLYFILSITLLANYANSQNYQDSVLLLNGKSYKCNIIGMEGPSLHFKVEGKKNIPEDYFVADYRVFSYTANNKEIVVYQKNEEIGNFLTIDESKRYAIGSYDARQTYKTKLVFWSSLALGYGVSLFDTYLSQSAIDSPTSTISGYNAGFFGKGPTIFPFALPILLTASFGLPNSRAKDKYMLHKNYINDQMYYNGFNAYAKQKRAFSALKGSAIGLGLGLISYAILKTN